MASRLKRFVARHVILGRELDSALSDIFHSLRARTVPSDESLGHAAGAVIRRILYVGVVTLLLFFVASSFNLCQLYLLRQQNSQTAAFFANQHRHQLLERRTKLTPLLWDNSSDGNEWYPRRHDDGSTVEISTESPPVSPYQRLDRQNAAEEFIRIVHALHVVTDDMRFGVEKGARLAGALLTDLNLSELPFTNPAFESCQLQRTWLCDCNLDGGDFEGAVFEKTYFHRSSLKNASFTRCRMNGSNFYGANLTGASFDDADLTGVIFKEAHLDRVRGLESTTGAPSSWEGASGVPTAVLARWEEHARANPKPTIKVIFR